MRDTFGRTIDHLRLAVTGACNFRCPYCMPNGYAGPSTSPLGVEEIRHLVRAAVELGITHIRLTGGEPLIRRDIVEVVRAIAEIPGVRDLSLTTNGFWLADLAHPLAQAGLNRVTISLDSLRPERLARLAGRDAFQRVWCGIEQAEQAGLTPLKLNVVLLRGINDDELGDFVALTVERGWHVRFIELMPVGFDAAAREFFDRHYLSARAALQKLPQLEPVELHDSSGPARMYRLPGARGQVGFITPMSDHFCAQCNRIRVTAEGTARSCLFSRDGQDLRPALRGSEMDARELLAAAILSKPANHALDENSAIDARAMAEVGG